MDSESIIVMEQSYGSSCISTNNSFWNNDKTISFFLFLIPVLVTCQPFFDDYTAFLILHFRLTIGPLLIFYFLRKDYNVQLPIIFIVYINLISLLSPPIDTNDYVLSLLCLVSSVAFFRLGHSIRYQNFDKSVFIYLSYGTIFINAITLVVYYLLGIGYIDIFKFTEITQKELGLTLFRFSMGNAIESPFTISCMLYSAMLLAGNKQKYLLATSVNLFTAVISQSRVVILIAFLMFLKEIAKTTWRTKCIVIVVAILGYSYFIQEFGEILDSLLNRVSGNDDGSKEERERFLAYFSDNLTPLIGIFGKGLTSSTMLLFKIVGKYRTIESTILQLFFETGIVGIILMVAAMLVKKKSVIVPDNMTLISLLIAVQLLFFLPYYSLMFAPFFVTGILTKEIVYRNRNNL
jgi:hypothetical protein